MVGLSYKAIEILLLFDVYASRVLCEEVLTQRCIFVCQNSLIHQLMHQSVSIIWDNNWNPFCEVSYPFVVAQYVEIVRIYCEYTLLVHVRLSTEVL